MHDNHLTSKEIKQLLAGELSAVQEQQIMMHLAVCERCQQKFDTLSAVPLAPPMELPAATPPRVKRQLFTQLHRSDLGGQILRFGTMGLLHVILSALHIVPQSSSSS